LNFGNDTKLIIFQKQLTNVEVEVENPLRNFYSSYKKYVIYINNITYDILTYTEPNNDNVVTLKVKGNPFNGV
jgi:hypothetical protein